MRRIVFQEQQFDPFIGLRAGRRKSISKPVSLNRSNLSGKGKLGSGILRPEKTKLKVPKVNFKELPNTNSSDDEATNELSRQIKASIEKRMEKAKTEVAKEQVKNKSDQILKLVFIGSGVLLIAGLTVWIIKKNSLYQKQSQ